MTRAATLSRHSREKLSALFASLPRHFLLRFAEAIAADGVRGGMDLPHDEILDLLETEIRRAGKLNQQEKRDAEALIRSAPATVRNALPFSAFGGFGTTCAPLDLSHPPDAAKLAQAEDAVRLLLGLGPVAEAHDLGSELAEARSEVAAMIRALKAGLARELRAPAMCAAAEAFRQPVLSLGCGVIAGWELAELAGAAKAA